MVTTIIETIHQVGFVFAKEIERGYLRGPPGNKDHQYQMN